MLILNEEKYAKDLYDGKNQDVKSVMAKIRYITRYLIHLEHKDNDDTYKETVRWMKENHDNFDESNYSNLISDAIKGAKKYPFYVIDSVKITKSELDSISSLNNLRAEKVLFVLLCMAKQQMISNGFIGGLVKYTITDVCKMARISVPADDREYILYNIVQKGLLSCPKKNDTKCLIVNCINDDDDVVIELDETDCQELAYVYLNWKNDGKGYGRCEYCGKLMKKPKSNPHRLCEDCIGVVGEISSDVKLVRCVDCNQVYFTSIKDNASCRCERCQEIRNKETKSARNRKYYTNHKE